MTEKINQIIETLNENGITYSHWYTEDRTIEYDLGGMDRLTQALQVISDNVETWCYEWELGLEIKIEFDFERISIQY
ncbi:hypothetical protein [Methanobrevibacter sp.]|uniref:hypothetical protein n=1 Tax=Methanobrevibacter sp. TaxID=66852 RepID=UPI0038664707